MRYHEISVIEVILYGVHGGSVSWRGWVPKCRALHGDRPHATLSKQPTKKNEDSEGTDSDPADPRDLMKTVGSLQGCAFDRSRSSTMKKWIANEGGWSLEYPPRPKSPHYKHFSVIN